MLAALRLREKPTVPPVRWSSVSRRRARHDPCARGGAPDRLRDLAAAARDPLWRGALADRRRPAAGVFAFWSGGRSNQYSAAASARARRCSRTCRVPPSIILRATAGQAGSRSAGTWVGRGGLVALLVLVWRELRHGRSIDPRACWRRCCWAWPCSRSGSGSERGCTCLLAPAGCLALRALSRPRHGSAGGAGSRGDDPRRVPEGAGTGARPHRGTRRRDRSGSPRRPDLGYVTPAHILGVMPWFWTLPEATRRPGPGGWCRASRTATASGCSRAPAAAAARRARGVGRHLPRDRDHRGRLYRHGGGVALRHPRHRPLPEPRGRPALAGEINRLRRSTRGVTVEFDRSCTPGTSNNAVVQNILAYWIHPTTMA